MKNQEEHDLATQVALLSQAVVNMGDQLAKLEKKIDMIMERYETKFATKEELQEAKDDIKELQAQGSKYVFWLLSTSVGLLISLLLIFIK